MAAFYRAMAAVEGGLPAAAELSVARLCDLFLDHAQVHCQPKTYKLYRHFLQSFCDRHATLLAAAVKPFHVTKWLDAHPTWKSGRWHAISALKRAFSWAADEGVLPASPIARVKKPPLPTRQRVLSVEERQAVLDAIPDESFRDLVFALLETGCRPGEVAAVSPEHT